MTQQIEKTAPAELTEKNQALYNFLATGMVPDFAIRFGIRQMLKTKLIEEASESAEMELTKRLRFVQELKDSPIAIEVDAANRQHYEVPARLYQLALGPRLKYSCCYFVDGNENDLAKAEDDMLRLTCERAQIRNGQKILDLGCGWGAMSLWLASNYPNSEITGVSNSHSQAEYIRTQIDKKGLTNLKIITADIRTFDFSDSDRGFDRIISVEMFEHMKNYQLLLKKLSTWLKDDGRLFVHIFTHKDFQYHYEDKDGSDWLTRYFFSGGTMPSDALLLYFQDDMRIENHWRVNGRHYEKTANVWLANMDRNKSELIPLLANAYGKGNEQQWWMYWRLFFLACAELWGYKNGEEWMVSHYTFTKS